jgi:glycolate oxidase iron-sulfur subunit
MADALRQNAIDKITPMNLQYLATSNSGCALHLAGGLREIVGKPQILQPIELIEMSLSIDA